MTNDYHEWNGALISFTYICEWKPRKVEVDEIRASESGTPLAHCGFEYPHTQTLVDNLYSQESCDVCCPL